MIEYTARITSQDTIRVGGRNLIRAGYFNKLWFGSDTAKSLTIDSKEMKITIVAKDKWNSWSWLNNLSAYTTIDLKKELGEYTLSFSVRGRGTFEFGVIPDYPNKGTSSKVAHTITDDWQRVSVSFKRSIEANSLFYAQSPNREYGVVGDWVQFADDWKLERGTIATDWTPAPEDLDNRISNVSTSLTSLASTLLDPNEGDIPQLFRQQDQLANSVKDKADKLELANSVSSLQGEIDKRALGLHLDNAFAYIANIVKEIDSSRSYTISDSGYISSSVHNSCRNVSKEVTPSSMACRIPNTQPQIRLTLRSDPDALKRQVDSLTAQLTQLQATTKITPVLNTDTRKRSGSTTLYPRYGDWLLTSDSADQYISFSGLRAEIGRSIYIQTRRKAYLSANGHSFYGLPGSSTSVNQWLSNNTTYRFVRASATAWLVTSSSSPYPWT
jgi:hypothetical protein